MDQEHAGAPALAAFTEAQRQQAMARFAVLRSHLHEGIPLSAVARIAGVPLRSVQRWLAHYRAAGLVGLARVQRSDTGQRTLPVELVQVIEGIALRTPRPSIAAMHRSMTALATQHHWTPPSYGSVYGIVRQLRPAMATLVQEVLRRFVTATNASTGIVPKAPMRSGRPITRGSMGWYSTPMAKRCGRG
jgi:putative transposase